MCLAGLASPLQSPDKSMRPCCQCLLMPSDGSQHQGHRLLCYLGHCLSDGASLFSMNQFIYEYAMCAYCQCLHPSRHNRQASCPRWLGQVALMKDLCVVPDRATVPQTSLAWTWATCCLRPMHSSTSSGSRQGNLNAGFICSDNTAITMKSCQSCLS